MKFTSKMLKNQPKASVGKIYCIFPDKDQLFRFIISLLGKKYIFLKIERFSSASPPAIIQTDTSLRLSQSGPNIQSGNSISSEVSICTFTCTFRRHYCTLKHRPLYTTHCTLHTAQCTLQHCVDIKYAKR